MLRGVSTAEPFSDGHSDDHQRPRHDYSIWKITVAKEKSMHDEHKEPKKLSFEDLGGKYVGRLQKPVKAAKEIRFEDLGGKLVGHEANDGTVHSGAPAACPVCSPK
jgi:hypothetical protein